MNRCQIAAVINISRWLNKCSWCVMLVWWRRHYSVGPMAKKKLLTASFRNAWGISELWGLGVIQGEWIVCKCDKCVSVSVIRCAGTEGTPVWIQRFASHYSAPFIGLLLMCDFSQRILSHILSDISYPTYPIPHILPHPTILAHTYLINFT